MALETSRQIAVVDAAGGRELAKVDVGRAPQAVSVSADGTRLYVQNFMDRTVGVLDLGPLVTQGLLNLPTVATVGSVGAERLPAQVLQGKQLFYDARDPRLARDSYMSCASCHSDAGHDGRTWDFTGFGEGLRNTPALKGRAGMAQGFVHWSANFDEIQDFEGQIRAFAGGTGLMSDAQFNTGTRNAPLGDRKAGVSADLDALAAYLASLNAFDGSPYRNADASLTAAGAAGKAVFASANCASCHSGTAFTASGDATTLKNIGTLKPASGQRVGGTLGGIDVPTLRDAWKSAPYLHDGSAATLAAAVQAHAGNTVAGTDLANLAAYLQQIGAEETVQGAQPPENLAPTATLATSYVSPWESLPAVNNAIVPVNSADKNGGAYGNWQGDALYGRTEWVSFSWPAAKTLTAFEVYWWNDALGIATPTAAQVEYWNGTGWVALGAPALALDAFNRLNFAPVTTTSIRVSMSSPRATGILEVRIWGTAATTAPANVAPTVALTAPANNASVAAGTAIALNATAADSDGVVARVEFYDGATLLGSDNAAPYTFTWANAAVGAHTLTARAFDNAGAATRSAAVTLTVTATSPPPAGTPPANATACANEGGTCTVPAGATATVWYGANTTWVSRTGVTGSIACTNAVFTDPLVGTVKACRYLVTSTPPANQAPTVALTAPAANASVVQGTVVSLTATAADSDGSVAQVQFFDGTTLLGTSTAAPYGFSWSGAAVGTHTLTARATDNAGAVTTSGAVTLTVTAATAPGTGTGLTGRYFGNATLTGTALLTRTEAPWFDWGVGAPAGNVPADNFSVRWSGQVQAVEAGSYQFRTNSDDGVRVWVNGALIINNWTAHAPTLDTSGAVTLAAGQRVSIVVEFQEFGGGAVLQLSWLRPGGAWAQVPALQLYPDAAVNPPSVGTGLAASYFANATLTGSAVLSRTEAPWFDWGVGSPATNVPADNFSVRWSGQVAAVEAGAYQFRTNSDDGVRVWVNGVLVINNWTAHAPTVDTSGVVNLAAGQRVSIVVEFQEFGGGAVLQLSWLRPGGAWAAVPASQLYVGP